MRRREFLALGGAVAATVAWPPTGRAQQGQVKRVGVLASGTLADFGSFQDDLRAKGWIDGQNISYQVREARQDPNALPTLAADLVRLGVGVILAGVTPGATAAKAATTQIPIVFFVGDAIGTGLVTSLAGPNGNLTGLSSQSAEYMQKMVSVIRDLFPAVKRIGVLGNADDPFTTPFLANIRTAAAATTIEVDVVQYHASDPVQPALEQLAGVNAVILQYSVLTQEMLETAIALRLPPLSNYDSRFAANGGLISVQANLDESALTLASDLDAILRGAKPGSLPVQEPTKFDIAVNLNTAKALGIAVPPAILLEATQLIQ